MSEWPVLFSGLTSAGGFDGTTESDMMSGEAIVVSISCRYVGYASVVLICIGSYLQMSRSASSLVERLPRCLERLPRSTVLPGASGCHSMTAAVEGKRAQAVGVIAQNVTATALGGGLPRVYCWLQAPSPVALRTSAVRRGGGYAQGRRPGSKSGEKKGKRTGNRNTGAVGDKAWRRETRESTEWASVRWQREVGQARSCQGA